MRIMIVDDEDLIRDSLTKLPDWETMGCVIVAGASHGEEALAKIPTCKPELIITDIRMPIMDGMELARRVRQLYPSIHLIFVTAFGDFAYARDAIKLGVADFITKPIQAEEVVIAVDLLMQGIKNMSEDERIHQERCLQSLFSDAGPTGSGMEYPELNDRQLMLMSVEVDNIEILHHSGKPVSMLALREMVCCLLKYHPYPYWTYLDSKGIYVLLMAQEVEMRDFKNTGIQIARDILATAEESFDHTVSIGISDVVSSPYQLKKARDEIRECLDYRMLLGKGSIVSSDVIRILERSRMDIEAEKMRELSAIIRLGNTKDIKGFLRSIYREMLSKGLNKSQVQRYAALLVDRANSILEEHMSFKEENALNDFHKSMLSYDTLRDLMNYLEEILTKITDQFQSAQNHSSARVLRGVYEYLESNYQGEITLISLAQHLHLNHSYLSRLIKKETGQNFRDFLWRCRIEASKTLLKESSMKAYEAAYQVGFKDPAHYSQLFKKMVGVTPTEYRESFTTK